MVHKTNKRTLNYRRYWYVLSFLEKRLGVKKEKLHKSFKKAYGIKHLRNADKDYLKEIIIFVNQEFGIIVPKFHEPDNLEEMEFDKFLKL